MLTRQAKALREVWLREREERITAQLAANAEVRRRWIGSESRPKERGVRLAAQSSEGVITSSEI